MGGTGCSQVANDQFFSTQGTFFYIYIIPVNYSWLVPPDFGLLCDMALTLASICSQVMFFAMTTSAGIKRRKEFQ